MTKFWEENDRVIDEIVMKFPNETMAIWATYEGEFFDELASNYEVKMAQHNLLVATRARMKFINREFDFQFSGFVHDNDIKAYGKLMGVSKIVLIESQDIYLRDISVLDIEKGVILYSARIDKGMYLDKILKDNNIEFDDGTPFYLKEPVAIININMGSPFGVLLYYGYRLSWEEFSSSVLGIGYFDSILHPSENLYYNSFVHIEKNNYLESRVKSFMSSNKLTVCQTLYANEYGGFTYIVNYSFDNYRTFGFVSIDSYGYDPEKTGN